MQHLLTPYSRTVEPYAWWEDAFTKEELDWLQQKAKEANQSAKVGPNGEVNSNVRRSELAWLERILGTKILAIFKHHVNYLWYYNFQSQVITKGASFKF